MIRLFVRSFVRYECGLRFFVVFLYPKHVGFDFLYPTRVPELEMVPYACGGRSLYRQLLSTSRLLSHSVLIGTLAALCFNRMNRMPVFFRFYSRVEEVQCVCIFIVTTISSIASRATIIAIIVTVTIITIISVSCNTVQCNPIQSNAFVFFFLS